MSNYPLVSKEYPAEQLHFVKAGEGPPALMIHGNPATHTLWSPIAPLLATDHTLYIIDLPGFGGSPAPEHHTHYSLEHLAQIILRFADYHHLERFDLIGHSFGGALSLTFASLAPSRLKSLAVICPMGDVEMPKAKIAASTVSGALMRFVWKLSPGSLRRWILRRGVRTSHGKHYKPERAEQIVEEFDDAEAIEAITGVMNRVDYEAYTGAIEKLGTYHTLPILLIGAKQDVVVPFHLFRRIEQKLPHASTIIFPECGHVPMWQYPELLSQILREFLHTRSH